MRWRKLGVWDRIFDAVSAAYASALQILDSSSIARRCRIVRHFNDLTTGLTIASLLSALEESTLDLTIRRRVLVDDEVRQVAGQDASPPLRKVAAVTVVENPVLDRFEPDLSGLIQASVELGGSMADILKRALGSDKVQSYGKAGLVGLRGEQEHANALLTTAFADPLRRMIGDAPAWISSVTKVGAPGTLIDIPVNNIHDIYVRSHYDAMSICLPDVPMPDEIAVVFCVVTRGRVSARVGGLTHEEAVRRAGLSRAVPG